MTIKLGFLGGASAIGASCVLVQFDGFRVVVDCGIRQSRGETLPDLRSLQTALGGETPDVVVLTHAHLDHSGALPVLRRAFPRAPIVTTRATAELVRILLHDAVKVMDADRDDEIPLYSSEEVELTLGALRPTCFDDPVDVGGGRVRLLPAGHILGAGLVVLECGQRSVVISGDISVADQRTVPGMPPPKVQPDVLVVESTYGDRLHASRAAEERRLCQQVAETVTAGGHVLIPAFAVGRAQEVLLVLRDAMQRGELPTFPVYADGMVRSVCNAYRLHPQFLRDRLRREVLRGKDDVFFPEGSGFERVRSRAHREEIIGGPPCCVVASSGMLAGGASPIYARAWATESSSLIAVTGYQDEEAPGRALVELAEGKSRELRLGEGLLQVECRVQRYHLSAHADADEIVGLVHRMAPRRVFVVHGDQAAREALAVRLEQHVRGQIGLPQDGELEELSPTARRQKRFWEGPGIARGRPFTPEALGEIRDLLFVPSAHRQRAFAVEQIAQVWWGERVSADEVARVRDALGTDQVAFEPDLRLAHRYRPVAARPLRQGPAPVAEVLAAIEQSFPREQSGLYRKSAHQDEHRFVLCFEFPDVQGAAAAPRMEAIADRTGWRLEVHPHPNQERLAAVARAAMPETGRLVRGPSLRLDSKRVVLAVEARPADAAERAAEFAARTGWVLEFEEDRSGCSGAQAVACAEPNARVLDPQQAGEQVRQAFFGVAAEQAPLKASYPDGAVVLHFVHPAAAVQHRARMNELSRATGREVRVHPHPVHQRLVELVRSSLPASWSVTRSPAYVPQRDRVRVRVWDRPPEEEIAQVGARLEKLVGCGIEVVRDDEA